MRSISSSFKRSHDRHFFPRNTFPVAESTQTFARCANYSIEHKYKNIVIIGGGIAGLSTARYLLARDRNLHVTVIDKNEALSEQSTYSTYDKQQVGLLQYNIPSRRNGNMLCPSLTTPWTTRSLWNEAFIPLMKSYIGTSEKGKPANISFDVPSLIGNRNMVRLMTVCKSPHVLLTMVVLHLIPTVDFCLSFPDAKIHLCKS